jgi:hypothetical protein
VEPVTVSEVKQGALDEYDHAVLIHDYVSPTDRISEGVSENVNANADIAEGVTDDTYTGALDNFVDSGGNLVVTDTGTYVLPELDNDLFDGSAIGESNVQRQFLYVAEYSDKNLDHPLFDDSVRPIQEQLWKVQPLGYQVSGSAPMDLVDESAFLSAANEGIASVAARTNGLVATGSVTEDAETGRGIHYISSLLPPATQANLHPFGLQNYTVTFLGNIVFTSALGFTQIRETGETTREYGRIKGWSVDPGGVGATLAASGSRDVDASVTPGGRANRVTVTVDSVDTDAESVEIRDSFPPEWELLESFGDGEKDGDGVVSFGTFDAEDLPDGDGDSKTFTYFIESPDSPQDTNAYEVGPAEALVTVDGEDLSATFAPAANVVAVGLSL